MERVGADFDWADEAEGLEELLAPPPSTAGCLFLFLAMRDLLEGLAPFGCGWDDVGCCCGGLVAAADGAFEPFFVDDAELAGGDATPLLAVVLDALLE